MKDCGYPIHDYLVPAQAKFLEEEGLPDAISEHVESCIACHTALKVYSKYTLETLKKKWKSKALEQIAWGRFCRDCDAWHKTWRGKMYLFLGGQFWARRAKWLGIPRWEDYKPKTKSD